MSNITEVTNVGWISRIKNALGGMIFGVILTAGAVIALFWNEGRAVKRYKALKEGEGAVISVMADAVDPANEGALVHLTGTSAVDGGPLNDPAFGISEDAVKLKRNASIYQWVENKSTRTVKTTGGGSRKETTYSYNKKWVGNPVNSSNFKESGHDNRGSLPFNSETTTAKVVNLGAFRMAPFLVSKLNKYEDVAVDSLDGASEKVKATGKVANGMVYFGGSPDSPEIGDAKVEFAAVRTGPVSVVAQQTGDSFSIYKNEFGSIELLAEATKTSDEMFADAHTSNKIMTWAIRVGGFIFMGIGIGLLFKPLSVIADVIPFVGNLVGAGAGFVAMILAGIISFTTIAIAWVFYRPVLGVSLLVIAVVLLVLLIRRIGQKKAAAAQAQPAYAGPTGAPPPLT